MSWSWGYRTLKVSMNAPSRWTWSMRVYSGTKKFSENPPSPSELAVWSYG